MSVDIFKILLVGDGAVGKTTTIRQFIDQKFNEDYKLTLGVAFFVQTVCIEQNAIVKLVIWDISDEVKLKPFRWLYYKGVNGVFAIFDLTRYGTFNPGIIKWVTEIRQFAGDVPVILIGNKNDLVDLREVNGQEALEYANTILCPYLETSAKTGKNIHNAFLILAKELVQRKETEYTSIP